MTHTASIGTYDIDFYQFSAQSGQRLTIMIEALYDKPMLNSQLALYNSAGTRLALVDPKPTTPLPRYADTELDSTLVYDIKANGNYYLRVRGVGYNGGSNYSFARYGAVGQYQLTMSKEIDDDILLLIVPLLKGNSDGQ